MQCTAGIRGVSLTRHLRATSASSEAADLGLTKAQGVGLISHNNNSF